MLKRFLAIAILCCSLASCGWPTSALSSDLDATDVNPVASKTKDSDATVAPANQATAIFAGGCFWCMEGPFDKIDGVISTTSGYTGGTDPNPTYGHVSAGITGHAEAVQVVYDASRVDYATLLKTFWVNIDPLDSKGQFCDKGSQYRSGIFYGSEAEKELAEASKAEAAERLGKTIVTEVTAASDFYPAEDYHQDYYINNPVRYKIYRTGCGRDRRLTQLWGDDASH